jgi:hypothetical protein
MSALNDLLASYLDVARHVDPLSYPDDAPREVHHRLGHFDPETVAGYASALKSIAHALEALDDVDELAEEVDRTMLLNTLRSEAIRLGALAEGELGDPAAPLSHVIDALDEHLENEDFTAESEAALRDRISAIPAFLAGLREDERPAPALVVLAAQSEAELIEESVDEASERLDEATVRPAMAAVAEHLLWLNEPGREGPLAGMGEEVVEQRLKTLTTVPVGVKGALRILELRRAGVERSLANAAAELDSSDGLALANSLRRETEVSGDIADDYWRDEWNRVADEMREMGLPVVTGDAPEQVFGAEDAWSMAAFAVRDHAARMLDAARASSPRLIRRVLVAPGLHDGWGRTVAALVRNTHVFGLPERRLMMSYHALLESVAAECDLMLQARMATPEELLVRATENAGLHESEARVLLSDVANSPLVAVATAFAHEGWQEWYAEDGGDAVAFIRRALKGGGLSVPLARWAGGA